MKPKTVPAALLVVAFLAGATAIGGCVTGEGVRETADRRLAAGEITEAEHKAVIDTVDKTPADPLRDLGEGLLWAAGTLGAGFLGLRGMKSRTGLTQEEAARLRDLLLGSDETGKGRDAAGKPS